MTEKLITKDEFLQDINNLDLTGDNVTDEDALGLIQLGQLAAKPLCRFLVIGAWKGKTTACLAVVAAKENGNVIALDSFMGGTGTRCENIAQVTNVYQVFQHNMKLINAWQSIVYAIAMPFQNAVDIVKDNSFNLIYLDIYNRYEDVKFILERYWPKLKNRGIICGRNLLYNYTDKKQEVDEEISKEYSGKYFLHPGIIKAVHEVFAGDYECLKDSTLWYKRKR